MKKYDPMLTMSALNMAIVSLHRIISTGDRVVLDREYDNIINNLRMGEINADPELTGLYQEIVRLIHRGRLRSEVLESIESSYTEQKQKNIAEIVTENILPSFSLNPLKWLGKLAASSASEYFSLKEESKQTSQNQQEQRKLQTKTLILKTRLPEPIPKLNLNRQINQILLQLQTQVQKLNPKPILKLTQAKKKLQKQTKIIKLPLLPK